MDRDTIDIRNPVGTTYKKLTVVVLDSDLELVEMHLSFRSGVNYPTDIKNVAFREGTRTRVINLPSEVLTRVTFTYRNLPGGGRARVQLWGGEQVRAGNPTTGAPPSPTIPPASNWTTIGERELADGGNGDVTIDVKNSPATGFRTLQVVAMGADVQITEMKVWFKSGKSYATNLKQVLKAGERSQEIALSSDVLTRVTFKYKDAPGAGKPRLQVVGK